MKLNYAVTFYAYSKSTLTKTQILADGNVIEQREVFKVDIENEPLAVVAKPDEVEYIINGVVRMADGTEYGVRYNEDELERCFAFVRERGVDIQLGNC